MKLENKITSIIKLATKLQKVRIKNNTWPLENYKGSTINKSSQHWPPS